MPVSQSPLHTQCSQQGKKKLFSPHWRLINEQQTHERKISEPTGESKSLLSRLHGCFPPPQLCKCLWAGQTLPAPSRQPEGCTELPAPRGSAPWPLFPFKIPHLFFQNTFSRAAASPEIPARHMTGAMRPLLQGKYGEGEISSFPRDRKIHFYLPSFIKHKSPCSLGEGFRESVVLGPRHCSALRPAHTRRSGKNLAPAPRYQCPGVFVGETFRSSS